MSDDVQDMLGKMPSWIVRWGISLVAGLLLLILAGMWWIRYPDVISASVVLTTASPPVPVVARNSGELQFFVSPNQSVATGDRLAILRNPANTDDVYTLMDQLPALEALMEDGQQEIPPLNPNPSLGSIQPYYSSFIQRMQDYRNFLGQDLSRSRLAMLQQQAQLQQRAEADLSRQRTIMQREVDLAQRKLNTQKQLFQVGAISRLEYEDSQAVFWQAKRNLEALDAQKSTFQTAIASYRQQALDLQQQTNLQRQQYLTNLRDAFRLLKNSVREWDLNFHLRAPAAGTVQFFRYTGNAQFARAGDEVLTILPPQTEATTPIGRAYLPALNAGKVKSGQYVRIVLDSYPLAEFGYITGKVHRIGETTGQLVPASANQPPQQVYLMEVQIPQTLHTTLGKTIPFKPEMTGTAEVVTDERRLLERLLDPLRPLFKPGY